MPMQCTLEVRIAQKFLHYCLYNFDQSYLCNLCAYWHCVSIFSSLVRYCHFKDRNCTETLQSTAKAQLFLNSNARNIITDKH